MGPSPGSLKNWPRCCHIHSWRVEHGGFESAAAGERAAARRGLRRAVAGARGRGPAHGRQVPRGAALGVPGPQAPARAHARPGRGAAGPRRGRARGRAALLPQRRGGQRRGRHGRRRRRRRGRAHRRLRAGPGPESESGPPAALHCRQGAAAHGVGLGHAPVSLRPREPRLLAG